MPCRIKKAYRKKALELHPDRNHDNVEACTQLFAEIQNAYEVLSDPYERDWYDSHCEELFFVNDEAQNDIGIMEANDILKATAQFSSSNIDFSNSPSGFFANIREIFERIKKEETIACRRDSLDIVDYPSFGYMEDSSDVVRKFYSSWNGFSTKKSFAWKDIHRYSDAPDRRIRRMMEKENQRLRDKAIWEFNDSVRSLVSYIKKQDPRYNPISANSSEREKNLRNAAAAQAAKSRAANEAKLQNQSIPEWTNSYDEELEYVSSSSESEAIEYRSECVACRKVFKSEKQLEAHTKSKKHTKAVKQLRKELEADTEGLEDAFDTPLNAEEVAYLNYEEDFADTGSPTIGELPDQHGDLDPNITPSTPMAPDAFANGKSEPEGEDDLPQESTEDLPENLKHDRASSTCQDKIIQTGESTNDKDSNSTGKPRKAGKAKQRRANKQLGRNNTEEQLFCSFCQKTFTSRNKLFDHLKAVPEHKKPIGTKKP